MCPVLLLYEHIGNTADLWFQQPVPRIKLCIELKTMRLDDDHNSSAQVKSAKSLTRSLVHPPPRSTPIRRDVKVSVMTSILYMLYFSQSCDFSFLVRSRGTRKLFMRIASRRDSLTSFFILLYSIPRKSFDFCDRVKV